MIPNSSFEDGTDSPAGWVYEGEGGDWAVPGHDSDRCIKASGTGTDHTFWRCDNIKVEPGQTYQLTWWARSTAGAAGGVAIAGLNCNNRDFRPGPEWEQYGFAFRTPDDVSGVFLRLGQWHVDGDVFFDDVALYPAQELHSTLGDVSLGDGESLDGDRYVFNHHLGGDGTNTARPLAGHTAWFNSNRWLLGPGLRVDYRFELPGASQVAGTFRANVSYHKSGEIRVLASRDGDDWVEVARAEGTGVVEGSIPAALRPADTVNIRLTATGDLQVDAFKYEAQLDKPLGQAVGQTHFLVLRSASPELKVRIISIGDLTPGGDNTAVLALRSKTARSIRVGASCQRETRLKLATLPGDQETRVRLDYPVTSAGPHHLRLAVVDAGTNEHLFAASTDFHVPSLAAADYGCLLQSDDVAALWWCDATRKVSRTRPLPAETGEAVELAAARGEFEPVQLVIRPRTDLSRLTVRCTDLTGPAEATIPSGAVEVCLVNYVPVTIPTDAAGNVGDWPDPLPPYEGPISIPAGWNQPLWLTVRVPENAAAGDYKGEIQLSSGDWRALVPLRLHVWNFTLPKQTHLRTAWGLSDWNIWRYHNLQTDEELDKVWDLYMRNFAEHRICPYNPMARAPIRVELEGVGWEGGEKDQTTAASGAQSLKIVDDNEAASIDAHTIDLIPIDPAKDYRIAWKCKTARPDQPYLVSIQCFDAGRQWISGRNVDLARTGSGDWDDEEELLHGRFDQRARFVVIALRPVMWSEAGERTGTAWFDDIEFHALPDGRNLVKDPGFEATFNDIRVNVDFSEFDIAAHKYLDEMGMNNFVLHLQGMGSGTFHSHSYGSFAGYRQGTPEYMKLWGSYVRQVQDHLEEKGWLDKCYVYWFDEPEPKDYPFVIEGMKLLKQVAPKLTRMLTEQPEPELYGYVDLWVLILNAFDEVRVKEREAAGEECHWYICTEPKAPYVTAFIDHPAIEHRLWFWMTHKYGLQGCLIWQSNYWTSPLVYPEPEIQNPWTDPMSYVSGYGLPVGHVGYWGNGDGRFLYPPNRDVNNDKSKYITGPINSIRWEMFREGIEDWEYFHLLSSLVAEAKQRGLPQATWAEGELLLSVPESIVKDLTHYTSEPLDLYAHRQKMAAAIERLTEALR